MMFKRLLFGVLGGVALLASHAFAAMDENYSVVLLTENYPPYNMAINGKNFAPDDNIDGISADVVREMFKRAGIKYALSLRFPWDRIYNLALEKPNYGVFSTARTPAREELFKWVGPIGPDDWIMLAKSDSKVSLTKLADAKQYNVGAYKGGAVGSHLIEQGLEPLLSLRDQENISKLQEGKIDLWATGDPAGRYLAKLEGVSGLKTVMRINKSELFLALNRDTPDEVVQKLQAALDQMRADGYVDDIINNYQ